MKANYIKKTVVLCTCVFLAYTSNVFSQTSKIDSLKQIVDTSIRDTSLINTLNALSIEVLNNEDISGSLIYSKQANELANDLDFKKGLAYAQKNIGLAQYYQGNYQFVLEHWTNSLESFESIQDTLGIANMVNNLGSVYYSQGGYAKALDFYLRSLSISEKLKDTLLIASALGNIGGTYSDGVKDYDKALEYFNRIKPYLDPLQNDQITTGYLMGVGEISEERKEYDEALKFYLEALKINKNTNDYAHNLKKLGKVEFKKGNSNKAIYYLELAYETAHENKLQLDQVQTLIALGDLYQKSNFEKAFKMYREAEVLANQMGINEELRDIYKGLSKTYENKGDFTNAFKYQTQYIAQKDSLFNLATNDKIRGLQFDFDLDKKQDEIELLERDAEITQLQDKRQNFVTYASFIAAGLILLLAIGMFRRYRYIKRTKSIIEDEKDKAEDLLLNILPKETAIELQKNGKVKAKQFNDVAVLFTDFIGFTRYSEDLSPDELVKSVDFYFSKFDEIIEKNGLEKIKTIGDAYMCAAGLPFPSGNHSIKAVQAAFEIAEFIEESKKLTKEQHIKHFDIRIGINSGPVVAGVVGTKKFAYDIWGNTVNVASRMESKSELGRINISEDTYELIKDTYECEYRGEIDVKNKGMMKMYFVNGLKNEEESHTTSGTKLEKVS